MVHYGAEGKTEFKVLAFIPAKKPFAYDCEPVTGLKLYVQPRSHHGPVRAGAAVPSPLRAGRGGLRGLALNVSRELLQQNLLDVIQKSVVKNVPTRSPG